MEIGIMALLVGVFGLFVAKVGSVALGVFECAGQSHS
jgi:hypothetical protein